MPDPVATPTPQATPATADTAFLARTSYQSDASYAAAYLAAHPEEAKNFNVTLPTPQATPTYIPGTAAGTTGAPTEKLAPDLSILNPQAKPSQVQMDAQGRPLPPGVPGPAQEALRAPAIDPTMVMAGGIQAGVEGGVMAGVKAAAQSGLAMEVQDEASKLTGLATNNPYLKGIVGLVAPIALSILSKRGISPTAPAAEAEPEFPQGTVLDTQGQPVTSVTSGTGASSIPASTGTLEITAGGGPGPGATPQQFPIPAEDAAKQGFLYHGVGDEQKIAAVSQQGLTGGWLSTTPYPGAEPHLAIKQADLPPPIEPMGKFDTSYVPDWAGKRNALAEPAQPISADKIYRADAQGNILGPLLPPAETATPQAAAQTLAEKQLEALKTARVGETVATEFGKPEIATSVPEKQTIDEGQALRQFVEMPKPPGARQPKMAAQTAAVATTYQDEAKAIRDEATRITAAQAAGQDMTVDKAALANRFSAYAINYANLAGMRSDLGRGLQILDPLKPGNVMATDTAKLAQTLNPDDVDTLVDRLSKLDAEQAAAMARHVGEAAQQGRSVSGMLKEYYYNALLSKPTTVVKKMVGDMTSWALNAPTRAIAARIPSWGTAPALARGEGNEFAYGSAAAFEDGLRVARNTWNLGGSAIDAFGGGKGGEFEAPMPPEIRGAGKGGIMDTGADLLGDVVRLPTRTIGAAHEFSRLVNFRGELRALALRQATSEAGTQGLAGEEAGNFIAQRTNELADNPPPELFASAHAAANYNVFSQPLGPTAQAFNDWLDRLPAGLGRFAFPFRRVPINLAKWALNYTPVPAIAGAPGAAINVVGRALGYDGQALGNTLNSFYSDMQAGGAAGQLALAKLGMGSAAMLMINKAVMDGLITGGGPTDPKQYHDLIATGWKPYALHVGDHYFTFQNLEPLAMPLGIGADFSTIMSNSPQADVEHAAVASGIALGRNLSRQSYVEMLANFNQMMDGLRTGKDTGEALDKFAENQMSGVIPAALRAEAKREDPVMRDTRGLFNTFLSKIPGYSKTLPPMTDALARPILTPPGFLANEVYPFQIGTDVHDPIAAETLRINASPEKAPSLLPGSGTKTPSLMTKPDDPNVGIPLTEQDKYEWMKLRASIKDDDGPDGKTLEETLNALRQDTDYKGLPQEDQAKQWDAVFTRYGHAATNQMIANRADLRQKHELRQQYKALGSLPPGMDANTFLRSNGITPMSAGGNL